MNIKTHLSQLIVIETWISFSFIPVLITIARGDIEILFLINLVRISERERSYERLFDCFDMGIKFFSMF